MIEVKNKDDAIYYMVRNTAENLEISASDGCLCYIDYNIESSILLAKSLAKKGIIKPLRSILLAILQIYKADNLCNVDTYQAILKKLKGTDYIIDGVIAVCELEVNGSALSK